MQTLAVEQWSRGDGPLHRRDPRAKCAALLIFLVVIATSQRHLPAAFAVWMTVLALTIVLARLPLGGVLARSAIVLPLTFIFATVTWAAGDTARAIQLVTKSYLSATAVLLVMATTPLSTLLRGLESVRVPRFLLMVSKFLYRYLFVIMTEAQNMRTAAASRAGTARSMLHRRHRFHAAAGAIAVLFARSYQRAEDVHRAMLARGFQGRFRTMQNLRFRFADAAFVLLSGLFLVGIRVAVEGLLG